MSANDIYFLTALAVSLFLLGLLLSFLARSSLSEQSLEQKLEQALPGVQCAQCGYPGCSAYAKAVASGEAPCNKCIPGGPDTVKLLADILGTPVPMDEGDDMIFAPRRIAFIQQSLCTGCHRCARHCPVDAIEGKVKQPHHILSEECIACGDCIKQCPEECIEMISMDLTVKNFNWNIHSVTVGGNR